MHFGTGRQILWQRIFLPLSFMFQSIGNKILFENQGIKVTVLENNFFDLDSDACITQKMELINILF